eukprot:SM001210S25811  [mRNA]  locus=s1210:74:1329:+ [translate_table: standard]
MAAQKAMELLQRRKGSMQDFESALQQRRDGSGRQEGVAARPQAALDAHRRGAGRGRVLKRPERAAARSTEQKPLTADEEELLFLREMHGKLLVRPMSLITRLCNERDEFQADVMSAAPVPSSAAMQLDLEPQYTMEDFDLNPDIEEAPRLSLEEYLLSSKDELMKLSGAKSDEEFQAHVAEALQRADELKQVVESYGGPKQRTARQENMILAGIAGELPSDAAPEVVNFTQRALLTLQNNPSWNLSQKQQVLSNIVKQLSL